MNTFTRWTGYLGLGGLFVLGGLNAAQAIQQQGPLQLDVNRLVTELGLDNDMKAEITPQLDKLNELLAERTRAWDERDAIRSGTAEIFSNVIPRLTVEQRQTLRRAIWQTQQTQQSDGWGRRGRSRMGMGWMMGSGMLFGWGRHCVGRGMPMDRGAADVS